MGISKFKNVIFYWKFHETVNSIRHLGLKLETFSFDDCKCSQWAKKVADIYESDSTVI